MCFIVMRSIERRAPESSGRDAVSENSMGRSTAHTSTAAQKDMQATSLDAASAPEGTSDATPLPERTVAAKRYVNRVDDANQRPASELINKMINDMGDPVMGKPLLAPHEQVQTESRDEPWATQADGSLRNELQANLGSKFEFPSVTCATDICKIQPASTGAAGSEDFTAAINVMGQEPWWSSMQLGHPSCAYQSAGDGRELVVCFLARNGQ
jgi:hypothetical protein